VLSPIDFKNKATKNVNAPTEKTTSIAPRPFWGRYLTQKVQFFLDTGVLTGAFVLAYLLRFDFSVPADELDACLTQLPLVVLVQFAALYFSGVYSFIWRFIGMAEIQSFAKAALFSAFPLLVLRLGLPVSFQPWRIPLSIIVVNCVLAFGGILALRVIRRAVYERYETRSAGKENGGGPLKSALLIGAGRAGLTSVREIQVRGRTDLVVRGFVDDDPNKQGTLIHGVRVLGTTEDLPRLVRGLEIDQVIITISQASGGQIRRIIETCERIPVQVRIIPGLHKILQGEVEVSRIRDVQVEDLLGRELVQLDELVIAQLLAGNAIMVTGAGGSIGSELARQVSRFQPSTLILVERAEFALFEIQRELVNLWPDLDIRAVVADVGDESRMRSVLSTHQPRVLLHAAAHKHLPMMEDHPDEAVKNNVLATHLLGELAGQFGVEAFVLISTDKAVRPTSVMGATKRLAELVVQDLDRRYNTRYVAVRFGNVMGSAGSVIPIFHEQIAKGGPVTVTHPDMTRYFMTIPEASQLVLQAGSMGEGGEIFILDMGEPVRILDLAKDMITLSNLKPFEDIDIVFTGIRPGEKLSEELEIWGENTAKTRHPKIFIGRLAAYPHSELRRILRRLDELAYFGDSEGIRVRLNQALPEARIEALLDNPGHESSYREELRKVGTFTATAG
jgi:FlaA1/EpsC-like NDP-sugar epimerase